MKKTIYSIFLSPCLFFLVFAMLPQAFDAEATTTATTTENGLVPCGFGDAPSGDTEAAKTAAEDCDFNKLITLAKTIINFLLFTIAMPLAAISFAWAGWLYLSSAGNESKIKEAHQIFGNVVLGLSLALAAWLIVNAIVIGLGTGAKYNPLTGGTFGNTP